MAEVTEKKAPWRPLGERMAGLAGERALVEGTPDYLLNPLRTWLYDVIINRHHADTHTGLQLKLQRTDIGEWGEGKLTILLEGDDLLEAIDATLELHSWIVRNEDQNVHGTTREWWGELISQLHYILDHGRSAWQLNEGLDGLTARVDKTVTEAARTTISDASSDVGDHLRRAWEAAYGFQPDSTRAYS
jgi:hypothetical protein